MTEEKSHSLQLGTVLNGKWVILEFIAKGGMGEIYRAHQLNLKRDVAIKIISKEWLDDISEEEEEKENALKRFRQEVHTMAQIRHPNVIQIYDFDTARVIQDNETFELEYIALEYIPGGTLRETMREEGFYPEEEETARWVKRYFLPVMDGVHAIHKAGIFHRDIKPENVLMDGDIPKIADFGLARSCKLQSMTCSMDIKGTPPYMAPEQFVDFKGSDQRTDIYALGKILYEAVDGKMADNAIPFTMEKLSKAETAFFKRLDEIIQTATDEKLENRYQSIGELKAAITEALDLAGREEKISAGQEKAPPSSTFYKSGKMFIALGAVAAALIISLSYTGYHYFQKHVVNPSETRVRQLVLPVGIPPQISAQDGTVLRLIPGGSFYVPEGFDEDGARDVQVRSFYMDETPVTNQQFVNFLNQIRSNIAVEDGAVKRGKKIYLYLGEALQGYEPIIYRKGVFKIKNSSHSACPVLRVTAYGANAYASFNGERLPTALEWLYAASEGNFRSSPDGSKRVIMPKSFFEPVELPYPVMLFKPNFFKIKGMNINLGCWVRDRTSNHYINGRKNYFAILGGVDKGTVLKNPVPLPIRRNPWEAFEEVGFRCVQDIGTDLQ